ncbi:hypothetical protein SMKI_05G0720 [Saccharomyces mikatae IFO 1815]|uniref:Vab2p n=1 Tax=Saccharomyces mikatae IFO 1815 TaxID=226126 RepID=A0AA35NH99_SACMI|nr:uncharacterized protein SMKI_05G0720 [Saccharomyces mikatae IFO 1815]CAI4038461.1 hypothetical protein SMKI_05G0720 [Saccharomyces mikatae IFO 1815]
MVADLTKSILKWKPKIEFDAVASSSFYEDLKGLPPLSSHKKLTQAAIFNSTKHELLQVKKDILSIYQVVSKDIDEECNQMQLIELQLKKSLRKVEHIYRNVSKQRASTNCINGNDRLLTNAKKKIDSLNERLTSIDGTVTDIVNSFVALDANLPKKAQLLKNDSINEAHYPLLFDFLRKLSPNPIVAAGEADETGATGATGGQEDDLSSSFLEQDELRTDNLNTYGGKCESRNDSLAPFQFHNGNSSNSIRFLPPTINKRSGPSIETNFENISADGLTYTKHPLENSMSLT